MRDLFRYEFQSRLGNWYFINSSGDVDLSATPQYLTDDPEGWEDSIVSFDRNENLHGITRKSSVPLKFHSDAAKILRYLFYNYGVNAYLKVRIDKLNRDFPTNNWEYDLWYECEVDFGQGTDGDAELPPGDVYFTVRMLELGLQFYLEAKMDTVYEIPADSLQTNIIPVRIGGVKVSQQYEYIPFASFFGTMFTGAQERELTPWFLLSTGDSFELGKYQEIITSVTNVNFVTGIGSTMDVTSYEYQKIINYYPGFVDIKYKTTLRVFNNNLGSTDSLRFRYRVIVADTNRDIVYENITYISTAVAIGATTTFDVEWDDLQIPVAINDRVYVFLELYPNSMTSQTIQANVETLSPAGTQYATYERYIIYSPLPNSLSYGYRPKELAQRILDKMTGGGYTVVSNLLDDTIQNYFSRPNYCIYIPSASIRQTGSIIKTSMRDLLKDFQTMYGSGVSNEGNNLRIETASYFYQKNTELATLEVQGTVSKVIAEGHIYGKLKIGYGNNQVDELNGLQSFCNEHQYDFGLTSSTVASKELDLVSPYIHDPFSIETIRSWIFKSDQTSVPTDNDVCVVEVDFFSSGAYEPAKSGDDGTTFKTGVKYPADIYNVGHSPKACLVRNLDFIKSFLAEGTVITFQTATKNQNLEYGDATVTITDNSDIEITSTGAINSSTTTIYPNIYRLFLPYYFNFKGKLPENLLALMETISSGVYRKYGYISLSDRGAVLEGFALDIGVTPGKQDVYQLKLLCSPNTDISQLIR